MTASESTQSIVASRERASGNEIAVCGRTRGGSQGSPMRVDKYTEMNGIVSSFQKNKQADFLQIHSRNILK